MENIYSLLTAEYNTPYIISGALLCSILIVEMIGLVVGYSSFFENDIDFTADLNGNGIPDYLEADLGFADWINPGRAPTMILLVVFSTIFTVLGLGIQGFLLEHFGITGPHLILVPLIGAMSLAGMTSSSLLYQRYMPKETSNAIELESLTGETGVVVLGPVTSLVPGSLRIKDKHGTDHYLNVVCQGDEIIDIGDQAVLVGPSETSSFSFLARKI